MRMGKRSQNTWEGKNSRQEEEEQDKQEGKEDEWKMNLRFWDYS